LFIERSINDLIKPNGYVCFINPVKFIKTEYGEKLKEMIYKKTLLELFIDMSDVEVFDAAITYTGIFLFSKNTKNSFNYVKIKTEEMFLLKDLSKSKLDEIEYSKISSKTWLLGSNDLQFLIKLEGFLTYQNFQICLLDYKLVLIQFTY